MTTSVVGAGALASFWAGSGSSEAGAGYFEAGTGFKADFWSYTTFSSKFCSF